MNFYFQHSYNVHLRKMYTDEAYTVIEKDHPPLIIEDLDANAFYEAYVVAGKTISLLTYFISYAVFIFITVNVHGRGPPSSRLVFKTKPQVRKFVFTIFHFLYTFDSIINNYFVFSFTD